MPANGELSTDAQTLGKLFRDKGYYTGYKGKWHLAPDAFPDMDAYGFSDWEGNDKAFWDKLEAELNLMNPSHAQPQTGYETEMEIQRLGSFRWPCKPS